MKSKIENYLTIERARELFEMRGPDVVWKTPRAKNVFAGDIAGAIKKEGHTAYRYANISCTDGVSRVIKMHIVAYALHNGVWPTDLVDHKNGNGLDNSYDNIRHATAVQNSYNSGLRSDNTTGVKGVTYDKTSQKKPYKAQLSSKGKWLISKRFSTLEEAIVAVRAVRELHHGGFCNHG